MADGDALLRMNYLYQASSLLASSSSLNKPTTLGDTSACGTAGNNVKRMHNKQQQQESAASITSTLLDDNNGNNNLMGLSRFYTKSMKAVARKLVIRMYKKLTYALQLSKNPSFQT